MTTPAATGLTLDAGALLALDHPSKTVLMQARLAEAWRRGGTICVPAGAVAQAWRGPRQVRLARLIKSADVDIAIMTMSVARAVGSVCAATDHHDVIDVHVALCARQRRHAVITSDPHDIARIDPVLRLIQV